MTSPDSKGAAEQQDSSEDDVPPANPAYSTPPAEGLPDAED
ncbi:hypothetical protein [Mycolicibacterium pulveris]